MILSPIHISTLLVIDIPRALSLSFSFNMYARYDGREVRNIVYVGEREFEEDVDGPSFKRLQIRVKTHLGISLSLLYVVNRDVYPNWCLLDEWPSLFLSTIQIMMSPT